MTRRIFARILPFLTVCRPVKPQSLPEATDILKSFDARDWAKHFVQLVKAKPSIATDPETMTSWFANALMRGFDEGDRQSHKWYDQKVEDAGGDMLRIMQEEAIRGAVARGWCAPETEHKQFDSALAIAITDELMKLRRA